MKRVSDKRRAGTEARAYRFRRRNNIFLSIFFVLSLAASGAWARQGDVHTFAGTGRAGFSGDGGPAVAAELSDPAGLAVDAEGNLRIADRGNRRMRKVTPLGNMSTVAPPGADGAGTDDPACAVAVGPDGALYVADREGGRVLRLDASGAVTTAVSGLSGPSGLCIDSYGNMYIADGRGSVVVMVEGPEYKLPVSRIYAPKDGGITASGPLAISGTASALDGVAFVEVSTDGGATWTQAHGSETWSLDWTPDEAGEYALMSRATDTSGRRETIMDFARVSVPAEEKTEAAGSSPPEARGDDGIARLASGAGDTPAADGAPPGAAPEPAVGEAPPPVRITRATISARAVPAGGSVRINAYASGGRGPYKYQFLRSGPDTAGLYLVVRDWGPSPSVEAGASLVMAGGNVFMIKARGADGSEGWWFTGLVRVTRQVFTGVAVTSFAPDAASLEAGGYTSFRAAARGGTGSYSWQFLRRGPDTGGKYVVARDWNRLDSWTFEAGPDMAGENAFMVKARNADGTGAAASRESAPVVVKR